MRNVDSKLTEIYYSTDHCVRCGRCTTVCPTYNVTKKETMLARGRIRLIREYVEGNIELSVRLKLYNDLCLGCKACVDVCPSRIRVYDLVSLMKREILKKDGIPLMEGMFLKRVLNSPQSFRMVLNYLNLARKSGFAGLLPDGIKEKQRLLPNIPPKSFEELYSPSQGSPKRKKFRVGYFVGCLTSSLFPELALDVVKVLEQHDCEVIVPAGTACCGHPHRAGGEVEESAKLARRNIEVFLGKGVDYIVTDCGTCGHGLREYAQLFDGNFAEKAGDFSKRVYDVSQFLVDIAGLRVGNKKLLAGVTVTYHESCHLIRNQNISAQPREILKSIPGLEFREMPEAGWCCGAAGSFSVKHQDIARKILQRKVENIRSTGPGYVAAGCPACLMQLDFGSREFSVPYRVKHPVQLLAETFRES
ncbi:MAG: (Fe-S)-binding protein [Bacillota bacterium]